MNDRKELFNILIGVTFLTSLIAITSLFLLMVIITQLFMKVDYVFPVAEGIFYQQHQLNLNSIFFFTIIRFIVMTFISNFFCLLLLFLTKKKKIVSFYFIILMFILFISENFITFKWIDLLNPSVYLFRFPTKNLLILYMISVIILVLVVIVILKSIYCHIKKEDLIEVE